MKPVLSVEEVLRLDDLIEKEGTSKDRPKPKAERASDRAHIAQSFREARWVLDELERVQQTEILETMGEAPVIEEGDIS